ncbi:NAD-dependent epimerase/dehydratase family protein [Streptomyces sioyaensis]|uniref:NAD-dependent epimerase/dehydratase family protein n=1 Tax=Streptomyces sioyaensis TaxID=67364 RepID=UPI003D742EA5
MSEMGTGSPPGERLLLTGASGGIGTLLRPMLARPGCCLRLLDVMPPADVAEAGAEEVVVGSLADPVALLDACRGVDAVIHLAGLSREAPLDDILESNVRGSMNLLEAVTTAGVPRVVLASSSHAVGFHPHEGQPVAAGAPPRPDTLYGWSKAVLEAAGRLYQERFGLDVICLRLGSWFPTPLHLGLRGLSTWLSPADGHRLVEAALSCESPGFRIVWGVSRNTRRWMSLAEGEEIGYHPLDDAEEFAPAVEADGHGQDETLAPPRLGGTWCVLPLG